MATNRFRQRLLTSAALLAAFAMAGCQTTATTGSIGTTGSASSARSDGDWRREAEIWGERYRKNEKDADAAVRYAQALRATGQRPQAAAVLEQAAINNPKNTTLLGAYGRALADIGSYNQAMEVLGRAHTPDQPDWRILSAQGAVLDQMGRHTDAQRHYASALKIAPDEPSVLSNLGLSYALSKNLRKAEETLRKASDHSRGERKVRQNLALVVGLQGRFAEAEDIARGDLPPDEAAANVAYLRQMISEEKERGKFKRKPSRPAIREAESS